MHWLLAASVAAVSAFTLPARALEFSGYLRTGVGESSTGSRQRCFALPGVGLRSKYRLGNECDHLSELSLRQELPEFADGSRLSLKGMGLFINQYGRTPNFRFGQPDNFGFSKIAQAYVSWDKIPALNGGSVWAGRKYYRRNGIHMIDFFYWNPTGTGFGLEAIDLGPLQLSYAVFRRSENVLDRQSLTRHDLQLSGFSLGDFGQLEAGLTHIPGEGPRHAGWTATVQHRQQWRQQRHWLAFQYGRGSGSQLDGQADLARRNGDSAWRLVERLDWRHSERLDGQATLILQKNRRPGTGSGHWLSLGNRAAYAFSNHFKLSLELGLDRANPGSGHTGSLSKLTIAPTFVLGKGINGRPYYARPDLRFYVTYARWNHAAQRNSATGTVLSGSGPFGSDLHGSNIGVQLEHWW